eukprot:tig00000459_g1153.t1
MIRSHRQWVKYAIGCLFRGTVFVNYHAADTIVSCCATFNNEWEANMGGGRGHDGRAVAMRRKLSPVVNGMLMGRFAPRRESERPRPTSVMISHVNVLKDIKTAVRAAKIIVEEFGLPEYQLLVYGDTGKDPAHTAECRAFILANGLEANVTLCGLGNSPIVLPRGWLMLNSSRSEGLPLALGEAGLCGLPVVCTDVAGSKEIIQVPEDPSRVFGALVPPVDHAAIARAQLEVFCMTGYLPELAGEPGPGPSLDALLRGGPGALRARMAEAKLLRQRLGMRYRANVAASFGLDRYKREHEQQIWAWAWPRTIDLPRPPPVDSRPAPGDPPLAPPRALAILAARPPAPPPVALLWKLERRAGDLEPSIINPCRLVDLYLCTPAHETWRAPICSLALPIRRAPSLPPPSPSCAAGSPRLLSASSLRRRTPACRPRLPDVDEQPAPLLLQKPEPQLRIHGRDRPQPEAGPEIWIDVALDRDREVEETPAPLPMEASSSRSSYDIQLQVAIDSSSRSPALGTEPLSSPDRYGDIEGDRDGGGMGHGHGYDDDPGQSAALCYPPQGFPSGSLWDRALEQVFFWFPAAAPPARVEPRPSANSNLTAATHIYEANVDAAGSSGTRNRPLNQRPSVSVPPQPQSRPSWRPRAPIATEASSRRPVSPRPSTSPVAHAHGPSAQHEADGSASPAQQPPRRRVSPSIAQLLEGFERKSPMASGPRAGAVSAPPRIRAGTSSPIDIEAAAPAAGERARPDPGREEESPAKPAGGLGPASVAGDGDVAVTVSRPLGGVGIGVAPPDFAAALAIEPAGPNPKLWLLPVEPGGRTRGARGRGPPLFPPKSLALYDLGLEGMPPPLPLPRPAFADVHVFDLDEDAQAAAAGAGAAPARLRQSRSVHAADAARHRQNL